MWTPREEVLWKEARQEWLARKPIVVSNPSEVDLAKEWNGRIEDYIIQPLLEKTLELAEHRTFESGATRDTDQDKIDYEGFLSPLVIEAFGKFMHKNRLMKDGSYRASDNWQKGIPLDAYMKSMWRHFFEVWLLHREPQGTGPIEKDEMEEALCALIFNAQGYLHELLKK